MLPTPITRTRPASRLAAILGVAVSLAGASLPVAAQPYAIVRWAVAGGGASLTSAGPYVLAGTVGQPAAGVLGGVPYSVLGGFWGPGSPSLVGVGEPPAGPSGGPDAGPALPVEFRIRPAAPNPFADRTRFAFDLPRATTVEIVIYDLLGARVRALAHGSRPAGSLALEWDARDDDGGAVGPGLYFARVRLGTLEKTLKIAVMR